MTDAPEFTSAICASDEMVRQVIASAVRHAGFEIESETTAGADLVESTRFLAPDLIVLDNDLPWRSGIEVIPDLYEAHPTSAITAAAVAIESPIGVAALNGRPASLSSTTRSAIAPVATARSRKRILTGAAGSAETR